MYTGRLKTINRKSIEIGVTEHGVEFESKIVSNENKLHNYCTLQILSFPYVIISLLCYMYFNDTKNIGELV